MPHKLYDVLGVPKTAAAADIKKAFKKMAVQHHPDKGGDQDKFKEVARAYEVLGDEEQRQRYDALGDEGFEASGAGGGHGGMDPHDLFQQFFGGGFGDPFAGLFGRGGPGAGRGARRCADHQHALSISLAEAFRGLTKTMRITVKKPCAACRATCYTCQGVGQVQHMIRNGPFIQTMVRACDACHGKGVTFKGCDECKNKGHTQKEHRVDIVVAPGVEAGHRVVVAGLGEQPTREGDVVGDLVVDIMVAADRTFRRDGADLHMTVPVAFADSVVGTRFVVPHFAGDFTVDTEAWGVLQPGVPYTIAKKGMPSGCAGAGAGDLKVTFAIQYPPKPATPMSPEAREAVRAALAAAHL